MKIQKICVLNDEKLCDNCGECDRCDLNPKKICDNCCECIDFKDFFSIKIDKVITQPKKD